MQSSDPHQALLSRARQAMHRVLAERTPHEHVTYPFVFAILCVCAPICAPLSGFARLGGVCAGLLFVAVLVTEASAFSPLSALPQTRPIQVAFRYNLRKSRYRVNS